MKRQQDRCEAGIGKAVPDLPSVTVTGDEPFGAQARELSGDIGLACTESLLELAHASFAGQERAKQTQTCGV